MDIHDGKDIMITSRFGVLLPVALLFFLLLQGCEDSTRPESAYLLIDFLCCFQEDSVQVELDDEVLYLGSITTSAFSNVPAATFSRTVIAGSHRVRVVFFTLSAELDTTFNMQKALHMSIGYDRAENKILVHFSDTSTALQ